MCDCGCNEITIFDGNDAVGIANITSGAAGSITIYYTNGTSQTITGLANSTPVYYKTETLGPNTSALSPLHATLTNMTYTVPIGEDGVYDLEFVADTSLLFLTGAATKAVTVQIYVNGVALETNTQKRVQFTSGIADDAGQIIPVSVKASMISLSANDVITVDSSSTHPTTAYLNYGVLTINKLS